MIIDRISGNCRFDFDQTIFRISYCIGEAEMPDDQGRLELSRRTLLGAGGSLALAMNSAGPDRAFAQAAPPQPSAAENPAPGKVIVERLPAGVLLIGIDRVPARNRIDPPILIGLGKALYLLEHDDDLRVAVLHGVGPDFVVGLDVPAFVAATASGVLPPKDPDFIGPLSLDRPRKKPVIAAIQGAANSVGHELALSADIRIAARDSHFAQLEVTNAVFPSGGATVRFTREAGWGNAMRYMLTGEPFGAEEAYRMGLVQEITPVGGQLDRATAIATRIASLAPLGVQATLATAHQALATEDAALKALQPEFQRLLASEDAKEARAAQQQGRPPVFRGR
jgi:enoyl-CoA hydratase/carnithine racemase